MHISGGNQNNYSRRSGHQQDIPSLLSQTMPTVENDNLPPRPRNNGNIMMILCIFRIPLLISCSHFFFLLLLQISTQVEKILMIDVSRMQIEDLTISQEAAEVVLRLEVTFRVVETCEEVNMLTLCNVLWSVYLPQFDY